MAAESKEATASGPAVPSPIPLPPGHIETSGYAQEILDHQEPLSQSSEDEVQRHPDAAWTPTQPYYMSDFVSSQERQLLPLNDDARGVYSLEYTFPGTSRPNLHATLRLKGLWMEVNHRPITVVKISLSEPETISSECFLVRWNYVKRATSMLWSGGPISHAVAEACGVALFDWITEELECALVRDGEENDFIMEKLNSVFVTASIATRIYVNRATRAEFEDGLRNSPAADSVGVARELDFHESDAGPAPFEAVAPSEAAAHDSVED